jgi:hypothetical protein
MELEVQGLDRATKPKLQVKLRGYKADLQRRKLDVVRRCVQIVPRPRAHDPRRRTC